MITLLLTLLLGGPYNVYLPLIQFHEPHVVISQNPYDNAYIWRWQVQGETQNITFESECFLTEGGTYEGDSLNIFDQVFDWKITRLWWKPTENPVNIYAMTLYPEKKGITTILVDGIRHFITGPIC